MLAQTLCVEAFETLGHRALCGHRGLACHHLRRRILAAVLTMPLGSTRSPFLNGLLRLAPRAALRCRAHRRRLLGVRKDDTSRAHACRPHLHRRVLAQLAPSPYPQRPPILSSAALLVPRAAQCRAPRRCAPRRRAPPLVALVCACDLVRIWRHACEQSRGASWCAYQTDTA